MASCRARKVGSIVSAAIAGGITGDCVDLPCSASDALHSVTRAKYTHQTECLVQFKLIDWHALCMAACEGYALQHM